MATEAQISELRVMINDPAGDGAEYADVDLDTRIDAADGNLNVVASSIWTEKAGRYSTLVDVQEGSSKRSLGSLYSNSLKMAAHYKALDDASGTVGGIRASRTRAIERP
jgi:hypothetical protein